MWIDYICEQVVEESFETRFIAAEAGVKPIEREYLVVIESAIISIPAKVTFGKSVLKSSLLECPPASRTGISRARNLSG
jgi:hypothetical protein